MFLYTFLQIWQWVTISKGLQRTGSYIMESVSQTQNKKTQSNSLLVFIVRWINIFISLKVKESPETATLLQQKEDNVFLVGTIFSGGLIHLWVFVRLSQNGRCVFSVVKQHVTSWITDVLWKVFGQWSSMAEKKRGYIRLWYTQCV